MRKSLLMVLVVTLFVPSLVAAQDQMYSKNVAFIPKIAILSDTVRVPAHFLPTISSAIRDKASLGRFGTVALPEEVLSAYNERAAGNIKDLSSLQNLLEQLFGTCIPEEHGGAGLHDDTISFCIVTEEIGRIDASWSITTGVHANF